MGNKLGATTKLNFLCKKHSTQTKKIGTTVFITAKNTESDKKTNKKSKLLTNNN